MGVGAERRHSLATQSLDPSTSFRIPHFAFKTKNSELHRHSSSFHIRTPNSALRTWNSALLKKLNPFPPPQNQKGFTPEDTCGRFSSSSPQWKPWKQKGIAYNLAPKIIGHIDCCVISTIFIPIGTNGSVDCRLQTGSRYAPFPLRVSMTGIVTDDNPNSRNSLIISKHAHFSTLRYSKEGLRISK